ncbi:hypothetical protein VNI00_012559 [Paramarasmius palmivorus]|uniref:Uncharacterized protein n=1 Tax=Paramarasmius palmivorus TaxID=297713 RepID=A0AAW0C3T4_9AGAR
MSSPSPIPSSSSSSTASTTSSEELANAKTNEQKLRPKLPKRKSCLKTPSPLPSPPITRDSDHGCHLVGTGSGCCSPKKKVAWHNCENDPERCFEEVFVADDWDRTPMEPAQPLSYKDILELKAIQRTLPRAQQLPDPYTGKKPSHFLSAVPIALLPLLPDNGCPSSGASTPNPTPECSPGQSVDTSPTPSSNPSPVESKNTSPHRSPCASPPRSPLLRPSNLSQPHCHLPKISSPLSPTPPSAVSTPSPTPSTVLSSPQSPLSPNATPTTATQPWLAHLTPPSTRTPNKPKPRFSFVPLLETPPSSASPSSPYEGPDFSETPQPQSLTNAINAAFASRSDFTTVGNDDEEEFTDPPTPALTNASLTSGCESDLLTSDMSEHETEEESGNGLGLSFSDEDRKPGPSGLGSPFRPIMFKAAHKRPPPPPKPKKQKNVMYINGEEIELDGSDSEEEPINSPSSSSTARAESPKPSTPQPIKSPYTSRMSTSSSSPRLSPRPNLSCSPPSSSIATGGEGIGMVVSS